MPQKCFCCSKEAIVIANTCSPTSATGMTDPRPWCAYCFLSIRGGVNIFEWLVSWKEARRALTKAIEYAKDRIDHNVNVASNKLVIGRGSRVLGYEGRPR